MGTENTEITVTAILDDSSLDKGFKKIATQAEKLSKTQTKGEQQSTASQKQAARIADKTRDKSKQDRKVTQRLQDFDKRVRPNLNAQELKHQEKVTRQKIAQERAVLNSTKSQLGLMQRVRAWQNSRRGNSKSDAHWDANGAQEVQESVRERNRWWRKGDKKEGSDKVFGVRTSNAGDFFSDSGGALAKALTYIAGGAVNLYKKQLGVAIGSFEQQGRAMGRLEGMGSLTGVNDPQQVARSQRMGYSLTESYGHASMIGRQTGQVGATATAQEFSRIYGGSVEEVGGTMGQLTRGGAKFDSQGGGAGRRALSHLFRDAVSSGLDASRTGEHLEAVGGLAEMAGSRTSGNVNFGQISGMLALLGSSGKSGFQGARGASFLSSVDESIRSGGPDDSSKAIGLQAMGYGYGGTNDVSYYQAEKRLEQGITGENGADTLDRIMQTLSSATGGGEELFDTFSRIMNVSKQQAEEYVTGWQSRSQTGKTTQELINEIQGRGESTESRIQTAGTSTNLKVNRQDANLDNRSASQGAQLYDSFANMQNVINEIVDMTMPAVISGLNELARTSLQVANTFLGTGTTNKANDVNNTDLENLSAAGTAASQEQDLIVRRAMYAQALEDAEAELVEQDNAPRQTDPNHRIFQDSNKQRALEMRNSMRSNLETTDTTIAATRERDAALRDLAAANAVIVANGGTPISVVVQPASVQGVQPNETRAQRPTNPSSSSPAAPPTGR